MEQKSYKLMTREERGKQLLNRLKIFKTSEGWKVPSSSGNGSYLVKFNGHEPECNCPDCRMRHQKCKHIYAVELYIRQEIDQEGNIRKTKGVKISYSRDWKSYDKSQTNEKFFFFKLLRDLCDFAEQPEYKFGRPKIPISDLIFASALKIYSTFSLRRFMSDLKISQQMGLIDSEPCYASVGHFIQRKDLTEILKELIKISATPLKEVESSFAIDSSGFSTSRFARYFSYKHQKDLKYRMWIKAHVIAGIKTNIITSVEVTEGNANDSPQLPRLVQECSKNFALSEVSCDRAYLSKENFRIIEEVGATAFIPFKSNSNPRSHSKGSSSLWEKMYHYFLYKHDEFKKHYNARSNVETVFHMIKTKFKDNLRSKSSTAQINELLLKILCHNICVVIQEINELGLKGEFVLEQI
ncbi:MAG: transposase [Candidatus Pacearchaeota archaeon]